jgi:hypothetical protein
MCIIKTTDPKPADTLGQLALYNGMDNLTLPEIYSGLLSEMREDHKRVYAFEMDLHSALLQMAFAGIPVDTRKRDELIRKTQSEKSRIESYFHSLCEAIGYYDYYRNIARLRFAAASGEAFEALPRSWGDWTQAPLGTKRGWKRSAGEEPTKAFRKWLKELDEPFNPNSSTQKLRLFYHFFGIDTNEETTQRFPDFPPPWGRTKGLKEFRTRSANGEYTPGVDRDSIEKLAARAGDDASEAAYWALPFLNLCLYHADLAKTLQFLNCKLDKGWFYSSFGCVTETGRLSSKKSNYDSRGWNSQNVTPPLRVIFTTPRGWKAATPDYEQIESRMVAARCFIQFGAIRYLAATECGDLHSLACSMVWEELPWPKDFTVEWTIKHGPFPKDMIKAAKTLAKVEAYRGKSRRDLSKTLGHGCLTADHEVLTPSGWVPISEKPLLIMQSDGTWAKPSNWIDKEYTGTFVSWEGISISAKITGDHRVYYTTDGKPGLKVKPAISTPTSAKIPLSLHYAGGTKHEPFARLLAAYHCDGHWQGYNQVEFHFHKKRKIQRIYQLAAEAGIEEAVGVDPTKVVLKWKPKLHAPDWSMLEWDKESLQAYVDELINWDGHISATAQSISSTKYHWLELWQTFNRLCGYGGNIQQPRTSGFGSKVYSLQVNNRQYACRNSFTIDNITEETHQVYCPTVPTGLFYVRRNGKIWMSGNSNYWGKPPNMAKQSHIDLGLVQHYQDVYFSVFPEIRQWHNWIIEQVQTRGEYSTIFGRPRRFFGRPSDDSTIREAIAHDGQSPAADYTNHALLRIHKAALRGDLPVDLFLQKHDEIGVRYREEDESFVTKEMIRLMEKQFILTAPNGTQRSWTVPAEMLVGWNLGHRSAENPDGLIEYRGEDTRTREYDPWSNSFLGVLDCVSSTS